MQASVSLRVSPHEECMAVRTRTAVPLALLVLNCTLQGCRVLAAGATMG
jgi:hypothetical protein